MQPANSTVRAIARAILACTAVFSMTACSDDEPTPVPIPGTLAVVVSPATVNVVAGASGTSTATISRGGSFTGAVTLTAEGAPLGSTVTFGTANLAAGVTTSTITITTTAGTTPLGPASIAIKASGTGVSLAAATVTLNVSAAPTPTVTVSLSPATASVSAGTGAASTATILRGGGFAGTVALSSATALPTGMTVGFTPATIAAGATTSAVAVTTTASTPVGSYQIFVRAAGTGVATDSTPLAVTVTAPVVSGNDVTLTYCAADAPIWLAYQDGTGGAWTRVTPNVGTNTYQFSTTNTKIGVATVDTSGAGFDLNVTYATTAEANGFGAALGFGQCGGKSVNGTVAGVSVSQLASITLGYSTTFVSPAIGLTFELTDVAAGPQDLFAARLDAATQRADKLILRRAQNIAAGGSLAPLDFNAAEAFAPSAATVTLAGLGADTASVASIYSGTRGSAFGFIGTFSSYVASSGAVPYDGIPAAQLNSGELQALYASTSAGGNSRTTGIYFNAPANQTLTFGPALSTPTLTRLAGGGYSRVQAQLPVQSNYNKAFTAAFSQTSANRAASITVTSGYQAAAGTWDVTIPAFSGSGWLDTWGLANGTPISWTVSATGGVFFLLDTNTTSGATFSSATKSSTAPLP